MLTLPRRLTTCAVPVLPAMRYGNPPLITRAVPPGPCTVRIMPSRTTCRFAALRLIARGAGWCVTPRGRYRIEAGLAWHIPAGVVHAFHTDEDALDVLAWHPDSDFGPRDEDHPMINRTVRG